MTNEQKPEQAKRGPKPKPPDELRIKESYYATRTEHIELKKRLAELRIKNA